MTETIGVTTILQIQENLYVHVAPTASPESEPFHLSSVPIATSDLPKIAEFKERVIYGMPMDPPGIGFTHMDLFEGIVPPLQGDNTLGTIQFNKPAQNNIDIAADIHHVEQSVRDIVASQIGGITDILLIIGLANPNP